MKKKPIKLYFLITLVLFITLVYVGINVKNFLSQKFASEDTVQKEESANEVQPEPIQQAKALWSTAALIGIILLFIFLIFKIVTIKSSRN